MSFFYKLHYRFIRTASKTISPFSCQVKTVNYCTDSFQLLDLTLSQTSPGFQVSEVKNSFKTLGGKGEIARNEQFLLFPQCFLSVGSFMSFSTVLKLSSANSVSLEESKFYRFGKC